MKYDELHKLNELREKGAITDEEYQKEKEKILNRPEPKATDGTLLGLDVNTYAMFLHLSQFCGILIPLAGIIVPLVLWFINKDAHEAVDTHGKIVINWMISFYIYLGIFGLLSIVIIGIPLLVALGIASIVFIIIGAVRAYNGEYWKYPFSITFLKVDM